MERQEDILGLTLSELAFFIVLVLLLLPLIVKGDEPEPLEDPGEEITELKESLDLKEQAILRLEEEIRELQEKEELRSKRKPSCIESKFAPGYLFKADIVDINEYVVNGELLSLSQLRLLFSSEIAKASDDKCVHSIYVASVEGLDNPSFLRALNGLERDFYTTLLLKSVPRPN